jgi:hypothetical protein
MTIPFSEMWGGESWYLMSEAERERVEQAQRAQRADEAWRQEWERRCREEGIE